MIIAGGSYVERCAYPAWNRLFGSGLRAAIALQVISPSCSLRTYAPSTYRADIEATLAGTGIKLELAQSSDEMVFEWLHPFELVSWPDPPKTILPPLTAEAECVLRFGMIEGSAHVKSTRAVYDPQNEKEGFFSNGSETRELVMIASERDLLRQTGWSGPSGPHAVQESIKTLFELKHNKLDFFAILLKDGLGGLKVFLGDEPKRVSTYAAESFFKIGSGDVLAAAFAHAWAERQLDIITAADEAARAVAWFVEGARLPLPTEHELPNRPCSALPELVRILGAETIEMGQLLLKTDDWVRTLGVGVVFDLFGDAKMQEFPTLVLIGEGTDPQVVRRLASAAAGAPRIVVFWPDASEHEAAHLFAGARVTGDYASALFHLLREPLR